MHGGGVRGRPYKALQGKNHRRRKGVGFFGWGREILEHASDFFTAPSVHISKKSLDQVWTDALPHLPELYQVRLNTHLPNPQPFLLTFIPFDSIYHFNT